MANKRKCKYCGEYVKEFITTPIASFCNYDHASKYAYKNKQKGADKIHKEKKKVFKQSDLKIRKAAAKKACHDYIRFRDKGLNCICCNTPMLKQIHAGHWLESGNNPVIRYDEDNIHAQSAHCNTFKGGDSGDYEKNLRLKIGDKRVDDLLSKRGLSIKRTCEDYMEIEQYFKNKLKMLK